MLQQCQDACLVWPEGGLKKQFTGVNGRLQKTIAIVIAILCFAFRLKEIKTNQFLEFFSSESWYKSLMLILFLLS